MLQARNIFEVICPEQEFLPRAPEPEEIIFNDEGYNTEKNENSSSEDHADDNGGEYDEEDDNGEEQVSPILLCLLIFYKNYNILNYLAFA